MDQVTKIMRAQAAELFGAYPAAPERLARARRKFRKLAQAVHPDLIGQHGLDLATATAATARLNELWGQWSAGNPAGGADPQHGAGPQRGTRGQRPHVGGQHHRYALGVEVWRTPQSATFRTDQRDVVVELRRTPEPWMLGQQRFIRATKLRHAIGEQAAEPIDSGNAQGHSWQAYRLVPGLRTLREVRAEYPHGLDGRDWAWMARRVLGQIAVHAAEGSFHGSINLDTVLIQPQEHLVMLLGYGERDTDLADAAGLFGKLLSKREKRQLHFAAAVAADASPGRQKRITADQAANEYDLLLGQLYGPRRFREFRMSEQTGG